MNLWSLKMLLPSYLIKEEIQTRSWHKQKGLKSDEKPSIWSSQIKLHLWQALPLALSNIWANMFCLHKFELSILWLASKRFLRDTESFMVEKYSYKRNFTLMTFSFHWRVCTSSAKFPVGGKQLQQEFAIAWSMCSRENGYKEIWIIIVSLGL